MSGAPQAPPKAEEPIRSMSLLGWRNTNDEYMGGNYRIRLVRAGCWEIRYRSEPVAMADGLKLAMSRG